MAGQPRRTLSRKVTGFTSPHSPRRLLSIIKAYYRIIASGGLGSINGVKFDLRHERLDIQNWRPFSILESTLYLPGEEKDGEIKNQQKMLFHWFGSYRSLVPPIDSLTENWTVRRASTSNEMSNPSSCEDIPTQGDDFHRINRGDTISIDRVVDVVISDPLYHPDDEIEKDVYLRIMRQDDSVEIVSKPFRVKSSRRILANATESGDDFSTILLRLCDHYGLKSQLELSKIDPSETNAFYSAQKAAELVRKVLSHPLISDETEGPSEEAVLA